MKQKRKFLAVLLALCLALGLWACSSAPQDSTDPGSETTTAVSEIQTFTGTAKGYGGDVTVTITVDGGVMTDVSAVGEDESPDIGGKAVEQLPAKILEAQSPDVDGISGATFSSNAIKEAAKAAMTEAGLLEAVTAAVKPGTYTYTYRGYCSDVTVATTVDESGITDIEIVSQDETVGIGSYALERLPKAILENQTVYADTISGATASSNAVISAVKDALNEAGMDMSIYGRTPDPEPAQDETYDTDVVVIGAGAAGFSAAVKAIQNGASVIIVEKMDIPGGNTVRSSGVWNVAGPDQDEIDDFIEYTMTGGHNLNNEDLVRVMVTNSSKIGPWLADLGFQVNEDGGSVEGLARGLITSYWNKFEELGGTVLFATKAEEILMKDGAAAGVVATSENGGTVTINAKAVIVASGGFGYDLEKCYELKPELTGMITNNQVGATGDGIYMAEAVGANVIDIEQIQAHPTVEQSTATLVTEGVRKAGGILLNAEGSRFTDECGYRDVVAAAILEQPGAYAYVVFNQDLFDSNGNIPTYDKLGIVAHCASTEEIAEYIGCDAQAVADSFAAWNAACQAQKDEEFASNYTWERDITTEGPWYVIKIAPGIHHTMGGIEINTDAQVISTEGEVIPGLFACGEVTGGVHGGNRVGGNALMDCQVFGMIAGENAANYSQE